VRDKRRLCNRLAGSIEQVGMDLRQSRAIADDCFLYRTSRSSSISGSQKEYRI